MTKFASDKALRDAAMRRLGVVLGELDAAARRGGAGRSGKARVHAVFTLLAASQAEVALPDTVEAAGGLLVARFARRADGVQVTLEARGAAAIMQFRNLAALFESADGAVSLSTSFNARGVAQVALADAPQVIESVLGGFSIVEDGGDA